MKKCENDFYWINCKEQVRYRHNGFG
jgi:hypothetical protein